MRIEVAKTFKFQTGIIDFSKEWPGADIQRVWPSAAPAENAAYEFKHTYGNYQVSGAVCLGRDGTSSIPLHLAYALTIKNTANGLFQVAHFTPLPSLLFVRHYACCKVW